jgi:UDP-N-acetylglucosamine 2-epimerase
LQAKFGLRPHDSWILVATSGPGHRISHRHHEIVVEQLATLCESLGDVPMVAKLHRKDRLEYYQHPLKQHPVARLKLVPYGTAGCPHNIFDWLQGCSLVLTGASTVADEAMLMEVPVLTMDFCNEIHGVDFIDAGATIHVTDGASLERAVREILERGASEQLKSRVQSYLEDAYSTLDGRASLRGAQALRALASERGSKPTT